MNKRGGLISRRAFVKSSGKGCVCVWGGGGMGRGRAMQEEASAPCGLTDKLRSTLPSTFSGLWQCDMSLNTMLPLSHYPNAFLIVRSWYAEE